MIDALASSMCPKAPKDCPFGLGMYPCVYDPSDIPFAYYASARDKPENMRDFAKLQSDLDGDSLPQVVFVRGNSGSHVQMEHSSIEMFIEWNWLAGQTGQLAGRDTAVANLGSLLDPAKTGMAVPEN